MVHVMRHRVLRELYVILSRRMNMNKFSEADARHLCIIGECTARGLDPKNMKDPVTGLPLDADELEATFDKCVAEIENLYKTASNPDWNEDFKIALESVIAIDDIKMSQADARAVASGLQRPEGKMHACMACNEECDALFPISFFGRKGASGGCCGPFTSFKLLGEEYENNRVLQDAKPESRFMTKTVTKNFHYQDGGFWTLGSCCVVRAQFAYTIRNLILRIIYDAEWVARRGPSGRIEHVPRPARHAARHEDVLYACGASDVSIVLKMLNSVFRHAHDADYIRLDSFVPGGEEYMDAVHAIQNISFGRSGDARFGSCDLKERGRLAFDRTYGFERFEPEMPWMRPGKRPVRGEGDEDPDLYPCSKKRRDGASTSASGGLIQRMQLVAHHLCTNETSLVGQIKAANEMLGIVPRRSILDQVAAIEKVLGVPC